MQRPGFGSVICGIFVSGLFIAGCGSMVTSLADTPRPGPAMAPLLYTPTDGLPYYLPTGKIQVDITWNKDVHEWVVKLSPLIQPDKRYKYYAQRRSNPLFDDDITYSVDTNGLLQTVNGTSEDKTVSSIGDLVAAVGSALTFAAGIVPAHPPSVHINNLNTEGGPTPFPIAYSFHGVLDPKDPSVTSLAPIVTVPECKDLAGVGPSCSDQISQMRFTITASRWDEPSADAGKGGAASKEAPLEDACGVEDGSRICDGIVVRQVIGYKADVSSKVVFPPESALDGGAHPAASAIVLLPDTDHDYVFSLRRSPLLKNVTQLTLASGVIQSVHITRPSLVAAIVGIPKTILGALAPIPLSITQTHDTQLKTRDDALKVLEDQHTVQGYGSTQ